MFEQSLLPAHDGGRKSSFFAASLTAQFLAAGVLILVPLFYNEVLPAIRLATPLFLPPPPTPVVLEQKPHVDATHTTSALSIRPRIVFDPRPPKSMLPARVLDLMPMDDHVNDFSINAPAIPGFDHAGPVVNLAPPKPMEREPER